MTNNNKGKRPMAPANSNSNVENITDQVNALARRQGITRNAAARLIAQQPGPSRRHAAASAAAAQRVLDNPDMAAEIAKHLASDRDLVRFGGATKAAQNAARRAQAADPDRRARDAAMPLYQNVKRRRFSKHTRMYPYQGRPTLSRKGAEWPYEGKAGMFCSAIPRPPADKYPTKAALLKRMARLHRRKRSGMLRLVHMYTVLRELRLVVNGMHLECPGSHERMQVELRGLIRWIETTDDLFWDNHTEAIIAGLVQRFVARISELTYHSLYIVMLLWGVFR